MNASVNQTAVLPCRVDGAPPPLVSWRKDGAPLDPESPRWELGGEGLGRGGVINSNCLGTWSRKVAVLPAHGLLRTQGDRHVQGIEGVKNTRWLAGCLPVWFRLLVANVCFCVCCMPRPCPSPSLSQTNFLHLLSL